MPVRIEARAQNRYTGPGKVNGSKSDHGSERDGRNPYDTANTILVVFAMLIMLVAVNFNTVLDRERKLATRVLFLVISIAAAGGSCSLT